MKLRDLNAEFIRYESRIETYSVVDGDPNTWRERGCPTKEVTGPKEYRIPVPALEQAQGVFFQCPKCRDSDGHGHYCEVTFAGRGVADNQGCRNSQGKPTRWEVSGTGLDDLTTKPSILLGGGCNWHGYITNGAAS